MILFLIMFMLIVFILTIKYSEDFEKSLISYGNIYKITNLMNKKVYIGQTRQNPKRRWIQHKSAARTGENHPLYNGMRYHGIKNFNFQVIDKVPIELLDKREVKYIKFFKSNIREHGNKYGYNLTAGGMGMKLRFIEKSILEDLIIRGFTGKEICDELRIGLQALSTRLYQLWQGGLRKARNYLMKSKIKSMIIMGFDITEIADEINMSRGYIYTRLEEFWNISSGYEARLLFRKKIIKTLLQKGSFLKKIADEIGISLNTVSNYIKEYWNKTYTQAKHFFMKPYIKSLIENGSTEEEITKK